MNRREFITLLGGALVAWPLAASAKQQPKMLRVRFVGIQPREAPVYTNFLKRMAELGYQEGRNFTFDYIQTPDVEGYERNYRELAARKVDVFLAVGTERALRAALLAAEGKPIVLLAIDFVPCDEGVRGESLASRGQCNRHFRTPARARRQTRRDRARSVPARDCARNRLRHDFERATRCGGRGGPQAWA
jgi:hypothetical protein